MIAKHAHTEDLTNAIVTYLQHNIHVPVISHDFIANSIPQALLRAHAILRVDRLRGVQRSTRNIDIACARRRAWGRG